MLHYIVHSHTHCERERESITNTTQLKNGKIFPPTDQRLFIISIVKILTGGTSGIITT